jgi:hypothetical protein
MTIESTNVCTNVPILIYTHNELVLITYPNTYMIAILIITLESPSVRIENGIASVLMMFLSITLKNQNTIHSMAYSI